MRSSSKQTVSMWFHDPEAKEEEITLPKLNYIWVGPHKEVKTESVTGKKSFGSDVAYVIEMAKKCKNEICFYCLSENVSHYRELFKHEGLHIEVISIEDYIAQMREHENEQIRAHANKIDDIRKKFLFPPYDSIYNRVRFKELFVFLLLATKGGYTLDTDVTVNINIEDNEEKVSFVAYEDFRIPLFFTASEDLEVEYWMMYASPDKLDVPRDILIEAISNFDKSGNLLQEVIQTKNIPQIMQCYSLLQHTMANTVKTALDKASETNEGRTFYDTDWKLEFKASDKNDIALFANLSALGIIKFYMNSWKGEHVCRRIVEADINEYCENQSSIPSPSKEKLLAALKQKLNMYLYYDDHKPNLASGNFGLLDNAQLRVINGLNYGLHKILLAIKQLDGYEKNKEHSQLIETAYDKLLNHLDTNCTEEGIIKPSTENPSSYAFCEQIDAIVDDVKKNKATTPAIHQASHARLFALENKNSPSVRQPIPTLTEDQAVAQGLFTQQQLISLKSDTDGHKLTEILRLHGAQALRDKLITIDQVSSMDLHKLRALLTEYGVQALRDKLITVNQVNTMDLHKLRALLTEYGVQALRDKLITVDQVNTIDLHKLRLLLTKNGVQALRDGSLTIKQVNDMEDFTSLSKLLENKSHTPSSPGKTSGSS